MLPVLSAMLALDATLHGVIIARFGVKGNEPPLIFGLLYAALTFAVYLAVPYAEVAALILSLVGTVGLAVAFKSIPHDKTIEKVILALNVVIILYVASRLFGS